MSCVRPGVLLTKANRVLHAKVLIALDFPELDRPAKAISAPAGGGKSLIFAAESVKTALANRDIAGIWGLRAGARRTSRKQGKLV